jgi:hypothetical protein
MRNLLGRIWAGIVGAVAGACFGFVVIILLLTSGTSLDIALWAVAIFAAFGAISGFVFGNKKLGGK